MDEPTTPKEIVESALSDELLMQAVAKLYAIALGDPHEPFTPGEAHTLQRYIRALKAEHDKLGLKITEHEARIKQMEELIWDLKEDVNDLVNEDCW